MKKFGDFTDAIKQAVKDAFHGYRKHELDIPEGLVAVYDEWLEKLGAME